jgi:hypothetical protein
MCGGRAGEARPEDGIRDDNADGSEPLDDGGGGGGKFRRGPECGRRVGDGRRECAADPAREPALLVIVDGSLS